MTQINPSNVFRGPNSMVDYYDPDLQAPLPLVEIPDTLNPFRHDGVRIYAKMMNALPAHNIKALAVLNMLQDKSVSSATKTIVEQSSGSTVISMSIIGRVLHGIQDVRAYITNKTSLSRMRNLRFFGLELALYGGMQQPAPQDPRGGIHKAQKLASEGEDVINPHQYNNFLNPEAHVRWTGPQLLKQLPEMNVLCVPMGTGGTATGTGSFLKKAKPDITVIGVCNVSGDPIPGPRPYSLFEFVKFPWKDAIDMVEEITSYDSYLLSMQLSREGLICGPSSGMSLKALYNFLSSKKHSGDLSSLAGPDGTISCIFMCCDLPYQYLDDYFDKLGDAHFRPILNENLLDADTYLYDDAWEVEPIVALKILFGVEGDKGLPEDTMLTSNGASHSLPQTNGTRLTNMRSFNDPGRIPRLFHSGERKSPSTERVPILLDLRSTSDFAKGQLPQAINIPLLTLRACDGSPFEDSMLLETQWKELDSLFGDIGDGSGPRDDFAGSPTVLLCYDGDTSKVASSILRARGVQALSIKGGWKAMQDQVSAKH